MKWRLRCIRRSVRPTMLVMVVPIAYLAIFASICTLAYRVPQYPAEKSNRIVNNARRPTMAIIPAQQNLIMSSVRDASEVRTGLSKTKEKELNSGLFRKINYVNKDFEFDEILSNDDVVEYRHRFQCLMKLFPEVSEGDLRALVFISPLLLALETETLQLAVNKLHDVVPFIDPSYVIALRSCGLDLLLSSMSPSFDLEARRHDVITVIGKDRNVTEFLRRVPHCLTPRYLIALRDHCYIARDMLQMDSRTSLDIVERWPGILGIDLVQSISRFNASLHRLELLHPDDTGSILITKLLKSVPRCLMQDMPRRAALLRRNFPLWDLPVIIQKYPRVLTQKMQGLTWHYQTLTEQLAPLNVSSDRFVNSFPRSLGYNPIQLLAAANLVSAALPGLSVHDIYARAPRILSVRTKEVLLPQIERLKRVFLRGDPDPGNPKHGSGRNRNNKVVRDTRTPITGYESSGASSDEETFLYYDDEDDEDEDFVADFEVIRGTAQYVYSDEVAQLLAIIGTDGATHLSLDRQTNRVEEGSSHRRSTSRLQQVAESVVRAPSKLCTHTVVSLSAAEAAVVSEESNGSMYHPDDIRVPSATKDNERGAALDSRELSVTRIIIGNLDMFIDRHPYFMDKVGGWIKDYGPGLSHAVLSAVPAVLTKKTTALQPVLKRLYTLITVTGVVPSDVIEGQVKRKETEKVSASPMSLYTHSYGRLNVILQEAPALLKKKPSDIDIRLQQLANILFESLPDIDNHPREAGSSAATYSSTSPSLLSRAQHLAVGAPRLLIESKIERIIFRTRLLLCFHREVFMRDATNSVDAHPSTYKKYNLSPSAINKKLLLGSCMEIQNTTWLESLLTAYPSVLTGPSSTVARLFFAHTSMGGKFTPFFVASMSTHTVFPTSTGMQSAPLTIDQIGCLVDCNTKTFISRLAELCGEDDFDRLSYAYWRYLQSVIKILTPCPPSAPTDTEVEHPGDDVDSSEGDLNESSIRDEKDSEPVSVSSCREASTILAVEQSERLLCGVFNDLCVLSSPSVFTPSLSIADAFIAVHRSTVTTDTNINTKMRNEVKAGKMTTNLRIITSVSEKCQVNIKDEVSRLDQICRTVSSLLIQAAEAREY